MAGHELAGVCTAVGSKVTKFKVGDHVGVGCMVDSCNACAACKRGEEQMCSKQVGTYNGKKAKGRSATFPEGGHTLGGYTSAFVVHENFAILIPASYPLEAAGPVMCAGVTMFDPLRRHGATLGTEVGIVGLGGLGQMGVKIAKAMGCRVTVISRAENKRAFAMTSCGADAFVCSEDVEQMKASSRTLHLILNTVPIDHDYFAYNVLLNPKTKGNKQVILGLHVGLVAGFIAGGITGNKARVLGSGIGSIEATQAVIDLCAKHAITPEIEIVSVDDLTKVYETLDSGNDGGKRYVLDIAQTLRAEAKTTGPPKIHANRTGISFWSVLKNVVRHLCA